jgi:hypothetical protein
MTGGRFLTGAGNFSVRHLVQNSSEAYPASYSIGSMTLSPGIKRPGRETDHSLPSSVEVENAWSYTPIPQIHLHGVLHN